MINMKDLIKQQGDMIRKESGMKLNEENESLWTWVYKGLLAGFKKAGKKGGNQLDDVARAAAFLVKSLIFFSTFLFKPL